jgi:hypothetical protein
MVPFYNAVSGVMGAVKDSDIATHQIGSKLGEIEQIVCPTEFEGDVATLDIANFAQALAKCA